MSAVKVVEQGQFTPVDLLLQRVLVGHLSEI